MNNDKIIKSINEIKKEFSNKPQSMSSYEFMKDSVKRNIVEIYYDELKGNSKEKKIEEITKSLLLGIIYYKKTSKILDEKTITLNINNEKTKKFFEDIDCEMDNVIAQKNK